MAEYPQNGTSLTRIDVKPSIDADYHLARTIITMETCGKSPSGAKR
jgi:hypothetical protein